MNEYEDAMDYVVMSIEDLEDNKQLRFTLAELMDLQYEGVLENE